MKLDLELEEINQVLTIVSQAPYAQVAQLIVKIQAQAGKQMKQKKDKNE